VNGVMLQYRLFMKNKLVGVLVSFSYKRFRASYASVVFSLSEACYGMLGLVIGMSSARRILTAATTFWIFRSFGESV